MDKHQDNPTTPQYWMSLEQWRQDPEFLKMAENEFLSSPLQSEDGKDGWARREFLRLMGASLALTTFGCVRRPAQKIIPYVKKPADITHGQINYYASSYVDGVEGLGLLVSTRDGRPISVHGNPEHPANRGAMSARAHAHILKLYDPDRFGGAKHNLQNATRTNRETVGVAWENLDKAVIPQLQKGGVAVLTGSHYSPSTQAVMDEFAGAFDAKFYKCDDVAYCSFTSAQKDSYGDQGMPDYRFDRAKMVVAINNDFLGTWLNPVRFTRDFMSRRKKGGEAFNKLVVFESLMSLTGSNADQRFRIRPSQTLDVIMALLNEIINVKKQSRYAGDDGVQRVISSFSKNIGELGFSVSEVAEELLKNAGESIVVVGGLAAETENSVQLQVAANFLNAVLGNDGKTILSSGRHGSKGGSVGELLDALNSKKVKTLIIHDFNPVYSLPPGSKFAEAMANVEMVIYTGDRNDETGKYADYVAMDHHQLENWGDLQTIDGSLSIQQPTIQPMGDSRAFQESLIKWMKGAGKGSARTKNSETWYDYLHSNWKENLAKTGGKTFDDYWVELLQNGVQEGAAGSGARSFSGGAMGNVKPSPRQSGFELVLYQAVGIGDGKLANVPWLQEMPDPITKLVWDNYATFSLRDATQLKIKEGQYVQLTANGQKIEVPAHVQPGQADGVVGLAVGYGRKGAGRVADGVGVRAVQLAGWNDGRIVASGIATEVSVTPKRIEMSGTQGHHTMEGRQIVVEETLEDHLKNPGGNIHRHKMFSMWNEHEYKGHKWGMVIDLNTCTGCSSCVIACQSENNIPTVGRKYVIEGREMHWLRIDRYYVGSPEDPDVVHQPLPCMHCDNAPCETVCPVAATVHSDEGTNDMIYNRCVGTRYCSNNCPYKVRRFNWFDYTEVVAPRHLALNPEVTVRHRGVMEKCSFCIHRIKAGKMAAKLENRQMKDGEVKTACQTSCPADAITFGDLNDPESAVAKQFKSQKSYELLEELNTKPAVRYQVKVRNTAQLKGEQKHHGKAEEKGHHA
jgi:molybdopterin-containing oxidoreductase family iron-sulfur binding subunit